jgi:pimeloyl-ACP methyl ester carboxylesterase
MVGSSMAGMIAQTIAIEHPERVLTLTSMMATTGEPEYGQSAPEGVNRQLTAMIASGSRAQGLRQLDVPTPVIHGLDDTLIAPSGGERTAALIPGARLLLQDMGHDRPEPLWPRICDAILEHTRS